MSQKKVYGKRKANAPRAVFEDRSPSKGDRQAEPSSSASPSRPPSTSTPAPTDVVGTKTHAHPHPQIQPQLQRSKKEQRKSNSQTQRKLETKVKSEVEKGIENNSEGVNENVNGQQDIIERSIIDGVERRVAGIRIEDENEVPVNGGGSCVDLQNGDTREKRSSNSSKDRRKLKSKPESIGFNYGEALDLKETPELDTVNIPQHQQRQCPTLGSAAPACVGTRQTRKKTSPLKQRQRRSSGCVHDEKATAYAQTILDQALAPMSSRRVQKFSSWASRAGDMFNVIKIAEGSYGEVYSLGLRPEVSQKMADFSKSKLVRLRAHGEGIFKVVPLRAQSGPGSKKFTSVDEIVSEVRMLKYLDPVPGFARFREVHVVQGRFPKAFQDAWDHYKRTRPADDCLNPNPASKKAYTDSQLWAILEMDDAGCELEKFSWRSIFQIYDIFWGVAMALARAEEYALFEVCCAVYGMIRIKPLETNLGPTNEVLTSNSTGISIWGMFVSERLARMVVWTRLLIWMLQIGHIQVDLALVLSKRQLSTTPFRGPIFGVIMSLLRLPSRIWTRRIYLVQLAVMKMRFF